MSGVCYPVEHPMRVLLPMHVVGIHPSHVTQVGDDQGVPFLPTAHSHAAL